MKLVTFVSELGTMGLALHSNSIAALVFGHPEQASALRSLEKVIPDSASSGPTASDLQFDLDELIQRLQAFAEGVPVDLSDLPVDHSHTTSFQRRVLEICRKIPWGHTVTYGLLADRAGRPGAARAVGSVMARNRVPLVIPCHRVVPASGGLGGFSAPQGVNMKRRLLNAEKHLITA